MVEECLRRIVGGGSRLEEGEILVADLDDIGAMQHRMQPLEVRIAIVDCRRADVDIDHHHHPAPVCVTNRSMWCAIGSIARARPPVTSTAVGSGNGPGISSGALVDST